VPILVAADRAGAAASAILPTVTGRRHLDDLGPVLNMDALRVTVGARFYPLCAAKLGITNEKLNQSTGEHVWGELHIQTVNSRHKRFNTFLRSIATKSIDGYLKWFYLAGIYLDPSSRTCLNAAMGLALKWRTA
jgi:hypothetical protein